MKNLIYQYWDGTIPVGAKAGIENMKVYAKTIGVNYLFEDNPNYFKNDFGDISFCFGKFKPVYDERFCQYDNVLILDTDIFAKDQLKENIFDNIDFDIGACVETFQPKFRLNSNCAFTHDMDEKWANAIKSKWKIDLPRTKDGLLKVYNGGLMLFSNHGLKVAREIFVPIKEYIDYILSQKVHKLYARDQNYLHAMIFITKMKFKELDIGWNSFMHYLGKANMKNRPINDMRTKDTKFVHIQLRGADNYESRKLWEITNLSVEQSLNAKKA
jgi:hypothetical protein